MHSKDAWAGAIATSGLTFPFLFLIFTHPSPMQMNELLYVGEQALILASDFKASSKISVANQHYNTYEPSRRPAVDCIIRVPGM